MNNASRSPWTPERITLLHRDWVGNVVRNDIKAALNAMPGLPVSMAAICSKVRRDKLERSPGYLHGGFLSPQKRREVADRSAAGESHGALAKEYDMTVSGIGKIAIAFGLAPRPNPFKQPKSPFARVRNPNPVKRGARAIVEPTTVPSAIVETVEQVCIASVVVNRTDGVPATAPTRPSRELYWFEIAAIAKELYCWRSTQDFLLSEVNARLIARGDRPVRIRKMEPGARMPVRYGVMEAGV